MENAKRNDVEPWLRGTHRDLDAVTRQVVHALELAGEDVDKWCAGLTDGEINARPFGLPPVAFHLRHIARSLDRLLSYAEGTQLDATQRAALRMELDEQATFVEVMAEFKVALHEAMKRVRELSPEHFNAERGVGRAALSSTVGGLLVHCADHTQRHVGQAITTAKLLLAMRGRGASADS